ncbi:hypothetical protein PDPUS_1_02774 [Photobacterium damselae subsp. piscicida]|uniref:SprT-like domain-containing protein n=1 Tax=Photobacterium damsela subsp. piscicida TaxID=38294 RepID=A0A1V1V5M7_PHODP|nr:hypothetical protein [Photobacterium damselae]MBE8128380.1 hypothetical protein [Photobacterium damselae subsp. piscicida]MDP2533754.1 hypothetical protein [Photobacterium damselae subsp. piscicida]MDP2557527.1 hypothetical protein [Photobacterium damselae subsp. piscicida]MDP2568874.1 hypothetical protein [Photobacterium damselae subsp. piscicida]QOD53088.1 hypothetical protein IC628_02365 [Photobacterium damselae subsp. piscicida]
MSALQQQIIAQVTHCIQHANSRLQKHFSVPKVTFTQRGKIAGSARLQSWEVRFNPVLLQENPVVTPIDLLMVKFTFYKRSNNLIVHLFAFRKTNGFSY